MDAVRKLGRPHLAFYRGWLQGMDIKRAADRYLESGLDLRLARTTLTWILQTLAMATRRDGRCAHCPMRNARRPPSPPSKLSSQNTTLVILLRKEAVRAVRRRLSTQL